MIRIIISFLWKSTEIIRPLSIRFVMTPPKPPKTLTRSVATASTICYGTITRAKERTIKNKIKNKLPTDN